MSETVIIAILLMQVFPRIVRMNGVEYFKKVNPKEGEKYISVLHYNELFPVIKTSVRNVYKKCNKFHLEVYDRIEKEISYFASIKLCAEGLNLPTYLIRGAIVKGVIKRLVAKRYNIKRRY